MDWSPKMVHIFSREMMAISYTRTPLSLAIIVFHSSKPCSLRELRGSCPLTAVMVPIPLISDCIFVKYGIPHIYVRGHREAQMYNPHICDYVDIDYERYGKIVDRTIGYLSS